MRSILEDNLPLRAFPPTGDIYMPKPSLVFADKREKHMPDTPDGYAKGKIMANFFREIKMRILERETRNGESCQEGIFGNFLPCFSSYSHDYICTTDGN